ncbi:MAG: hypothetical protein OXU40_07680 [Nitrospira sp.]|nr:hypothetical protein [Nitrospira sp.]
MYVCVCKGITECNVEELGCAGVTCPDKLAAALGIDDKETCCGRCLNHIADLAVIASRGHRRYSTSVQA